MKLKTEERKSIKGLSSSAASFFDVLEQGEFGEFSSVSELCNTLSSSPQFVAFSCLKGNSGDQRLEGGLGTFFGTRLQQAAEKFLAKARSVQDVSFTVILDDCEPTKVWGWSDESHRFSEQLRGLINSSEIPACWEVLLWSDIFAPSSVVYEDVVVQMADSKFNLLKSNTLRHMQKFPNKKLLGNVRDAAFRRVAWYAFQGRVLEEQLPNAILCQSESPWSVKDPLYHPLRSKKLPIIHPFFEERR